MAAPSRKEELLRAASAIVREKGALALTLDALGAATGTSKGGVLYHFPTKESLVRGMVEAELHAYEDSLEAALAQEGPGQGAFARAYIRSSFAGSSNLGQGLSGILAAAASDPVLLETYRKATSLWRKRMGQDGLGPGVAEAIRLAVDGLYYSAALGTALPTRQGLKELEAFLLSLAEGGENGA